MSNLIGSDTVSGPYDGPHGSLLEQIRGAKTPVQLPGGVERKFLEDGDTIIVRGWAGTEEDRLVGFGNCDGKILDALHLL